MENCVNNSINEKLEIPSIEKKLGDVKIGEKNYKEAIHHYKSSIIAMKILFDEEHIFENDKNATELIEEVGIPVHLNLALCFLQLEDWKKVIFYCNKVLELKPDNIKAIYRRCKAYIELKDV